MTEIHYVVEIKNCVGQWVIYTTRSTKRNAMACAAQRAKLGDEPLRVIRRQSKETVIAHYLKKSKGSK